MSKAPERIFSAYSGPGGGYDKPARAIAYIREDLYEAVKAERDALKAERDELLAALKPFADEAPKWDDFRHDECLVEGWNEGPESTLTVNDLRHAYAIFAHIKVKEGTL